MQTRWASLPNTVPDIEEGAGTESTVSTTLIKCFKKLFLQHPALAHPQTAVDRSDSSF